MKYFLVALGWWLLPVPPLAAQLGSTPEVADEATVDVASFTGVLTGDYTNGAPKFRKEVTAGKASGRWEEWYPDGMLRFSSWWKDGLGHGKWTYYYPDGKVRSVGIYARDQPQGIHHYYHRNGQLSQEIPYVEGKTEGIVWKWDPTGLPLSRQRYLSGQKVLDLPVLFEPGKISTASNNEWGITFTPSGDTLYFVRRDTGISKKALYATYQTAGQWSAPVKANFGRPDEGGAFISPDGRRLFTDFPSPTPDGRLDFNLWVRDKTNAGWTAPRRLGSNINATPAVQDEWPAGYEAGPTADTKGNLYFWTKGKNSTYGKLFTAAPDGKGGFNKAIPLPGYPTGAGWDITPVISPDGNYLLFASSDRSESYGREDLYYAKRTATGWSEVRNLGPDVNSSSYENSPRFSPDGKYLFFTSDRAGNKDANGDRIWNIYYLETRFLMVE